MKSTITAYCWFRVFPKRPARMKRAIQEQVYDVMRKNGLFVFSEEMTETTINKEQTH